MKETLKKSFYKNRYLVIIAIWLYVISLLISLFSSVSTTPATVKENFQDYILAGEKTFEQFAADTKAIQSVVQLNANPNKAFAYTNNKTMLYVYTRNDVGNLLLTFWNTNKVSPQINDLNGPDKKKLVRYSNGEFELIKRNIIVNGKEVIIAGLIPIRWNYFFANEYLVTDFPALEMGDQKYEDAQDTGKIVINSSDGKPFYTLNEKTQWHSYMRSNWSLFFKIISVCFFLAFINMIAFDISRTTSWLKGFGFLFIIVFILRSLSYFLPFPFSYRKMELFDPAIYASNGLHPSLGDLFINMILLFWLVSFIKYTAMQLFKHLPQYTGKKAWNVTIIISVLLVIISFTAASIIRSLIVDSQIPFDVSNFFRLNIYSLISFITLCFITLSFFTISNLLLLHVYKCKHVPVYVKFVAIAITGLIYLTVNLDQPAMQSNMVVLLWLLIFLVIMEFRRADLYVPLMRSSFFLLWLIFFASSISGLVIYQSREVELDERKKHAEKLALQFDPTSANILNIGIARFSNLFLEPNYHRFYNEADNKFIKDSLTNENFSAYLNKYDTQIFTFDSASMPLFNDDQISYDVVLNNITNQSKKTASPDVYYYENSFDRFSFFYHKELKRADGKIIGYFFVVANPKKYKSESLYPELFKLVRDNSKDLDITNAYAIYNRGEIINHFGDYNFISRINTELYRQQDFKEIKKKGYSELWHNAGNGKIVVIVKSTSLLYQTVTLFAYLFGTFLFIVVLFHAVQFFIHTRFKWKRILSNLRLNIRNQIQTTIIFISLFSFVVIGVATIIFYVNRFEKSNRQRLVKSINMMANEIKHQIATHSMEDDGLKLYDVGPRNELQRNINDIAEIHNIDVNFYDLSGNLIISTQPYIYRKQVLSLMMEPKAYYALHHKNEIQVIQNELIGNFKFTSIYAPVRDAAGKPYAYLNVPYLSSKAELDQEISNFLVTLINLNAFIFVFAGAIAFLVTSRITGSFTLISNKMREVHLGQANEEIVWHTNDEIGALVNEYNKMVRKLEDSAQALAKSEREGAWREMAKQVAHEIKNPLTPMKLSIQYLQRNIQDNHPDVKQLSKTVADTLVEQIDQLAKIASDFSQFANIGQGRVEVFDVHEVLTSLINLYSTNEQLQIVWNKPDQPAVIQADRNQVNRLFTNLLQNAVEASAGKEPIEIIVDEKMDGNKLLISIADKGQGIPVEKMEKIFTPNFTTKSSGTGLGLAICKGIVEKANGKIWFDTAEGEGTTFHVMLPLVGLPG